MPTGGHEEVDHCTGDQLADTEKAKFFCITVIIIIYYREHRHHIKKSRFFV